MNVKIKCRDWLGWTGIRRLFMCECEYALPHDEEAAHALVILETYVLV